MAISVNHNTSVLNALHQHTNQRNESDEKLASGKKINKAADDAAGLQISNRLTAQINEAEQRAINSQDNVNLNTVKEGGLSAINESLQRANELAIQSGNPLTDKTAIQSELTQLTEQVNTLAESVLGNANFLASLDANDPSSTQDALANALTEVNQVTTELGANSNVLTNQVNTYQATTVNVSASRSRIQDTDYASSSATLQQNQTLIQSAIISQKDEEARKGLLINNLV
ncbi:flagellin [Thalassotalea profundi]|uniref:Flagellin n=1 Tax=Thalassotalea profundi TaxID=2036687 RepID=A0ABQ3J0Y9_9GAMM|nr:flagellin [Thalassotalea profundi]GHE99938.1 hypothetical protein GCM10011501_31680 [Thalassotalea profundi]